MASRRLTAVLCAVAVVAVACGGGGSTASADRSVTADAAGDTTDWDPQEAIARTTLIETAMDAGMKRSHVSCLVDTVVAAGWSLDDLEGVDLTAQTNSGVAPDLADALATGRVECGPKLSALLEEDLPGWAAIPDTYADAAGCVKDGYRTAWHDAYAARYSGRVDSGQTPTPVDVSADLIVVVDACEAGGAVLLGASNEGSVETSALSTLEWGCLVARLDPAQFMLALPFPDEPGDALERMGSVVDPDVAYCREWASSGDGANG